MQILHTNVTYTLYGAGTAWYSEWWNKTKSPGSDSIATEGSSGPHTPKVFSFQVGWVLCTPCHPCRGFRRCWNSARSNGQDAHTRSSE